MIRHILTHFIRRRATLVLGLVLSASAHGQPADYPSRPVHVIVPYQAGQGTDLAARIIVDRLNRQYPGKFLVENRPGASGSIGTTVAANAKPDGHTIVMGGNATHAVNSALFPKLAYDPIKSFDPIVMYYEGGMVLTTLPASPYKDMKEVIAAARLKPGAVDVASPSITARMALALLTSGAGVDLKPIPYQGSVPALTDLLGGRVPLLMDTFTASLARIKRGELKPLAVSMSKRSPYLPDVPTLEEVGATGAVLTTWNAFFVPKGTPAEITNLLNRAMNTAIASKEVQDFLATSGARSLGGTPSEAATFVQAEYKKLGDIIRKEKIQAD